MIVSSSAVSGDNVDDDDDDDVEGVFVKRSVNAEGVKISVARGR